MQSNSNSARDCLFLGKAAFNKGLYDRAYNWLQAALQVSESEAMTNKITAEKKEILPFLETTKRVVSIFTDYAFQ